MDEFGRLPQTSLYNSEVVTVAHIKVGNNHHHTARENLSCCCRKLTMLSIVIIMQEVLRRVYMTV